MRYVSMLTLVGTLGLAVGCASGPDQKEETQPTQQPKKVEKVEEPSPEELADHPCGNTQWAQLPDDHKEDGDRQGDGERLEAPEDEQPAGEEPSEEESPEEKSSEQKSPEQKPSEGASGDEKPSSDQ